MGIISSIQALSAVQKIKKGGNAELSIAQISSLIINLSDAKKNLSDFEFSTVYALYEEFQKCKAKTSLNVETYVNTSIKIIRIFDEIAPYEKYSGGNELEFSFMMDDIRSQNQSDNCQE